ncbi:transmembrane protein, putative (macronuclear) [Tetrahymena thermophila SB210]|uniref:Transmembrane protein, putative n=1 Tax=Tetrahymena thermophila (strain SB210) TaxID=312017 RepID=W7X5D5_TETTS|nr:transmembrane protein, putative [Tetrahymena thermophila SB210]EWS71568.1 transmembrane protein, putative [Tetrahymena thermophila SB210]|eukprot:XP_012655897.1 transmembrane protein, putative [Tetrahymena thermophila SB210]
MSTTISSLTLSLKQNYLILFFGFINSFFILNSNVKKSKNSIQKIFSNLKNFLILFQQNLIFIFSLFFLFLFIYFIPFKSANEITCNGVSSLGQALAKCANLTNMALYFMQLQFIYLCIQIKNYLMIKTIINHLFIFLKINFEINKKYLNFLILNHNYIYK